MYEKIARAMKETCYERSADQYRKIKDAHNKTGIYRKKKLDFFNAMDNILGDKPSTQPPVLVDTLDLNDEDAENSIGDTSASTAESNGKDNITDSSSLCDAGSHSTTPPERKKKRIREYKAVKVMKDVV